jgi:hypothetical protein
MTLLIEGARPVWAISGTHGMDAWIVVDGDDVCLTSEDIAGARRELESPDNVSGLAPLGPVFVDESQLTAILHGPALDDCRWCSGPGLVTVEGVLVCPGHAAGFGMAESESMEAAR